MTNHKIISHPNYQSNAVFYSIILVKYLFNKLIFAYFVIVILKEIIKMLRFFPTVIFAMSCIVATAQQKTDDNSSEEVVTKTIRIKGGNGEEKVIKKKEVITKKSNIEFNPLEEDATNRTAIYNDEKVSVKKSHSSTDMDSYAMVADAKGFTITFISKTGTKTAKLRAISKDYYLINNGYKDNSVGHFDSDKNFIVESYNETTDQIMTTIYTQRKTVN